MITGSEEEYERSDMEAEEFEPREKTKHEL